MDEKFQDRIDDYLLNRMNEDEKIEFHRVVEQDKEKKMQLEFTQNVKDCIRSREEKLKAIANFQRQYEEEQTASAYRPTGTGHAVRNCAAPSYMEERYVWPKKKWLWISAVAAVLVVGFFAIKPMFDYEPSPNYNGAPMEQMRGGDEVFSPAPADSMVNDTIMNEKEATHDE